MGLFNGTNQSETEIREFINVRKIKYENIFCTLIIAIALFITVYFGISRLFSGCVSPSFTTEDNDAPNIKKQDVIKKEISFLLRKT